MHDVEEKCIHSCSRETWRWDVTLKT